MCHVYIHLRLKDQDSVTRADAKVMVEIVLEALVTRYKYCRLITFTIKLCVGVGLARL